MAANGRNKSNPWRLTWRHKTVTLKFRGAGGEVTAHASGVWLICPSTEGRRIWMFKGWAGTSHTALGTEQCIQFVQVRSDTGYSYSNIPDGQGQVWIDLDAGWGGSPYEFWQGGISIYLRSFLSPEHTWTMTKTYDIRRQSKSGS